MAYFSNGSEGEILDNQCAECPLGDAPCPVALVQMLYNYKQVNVAPLEAAMNMLVNEKGICLMKKEIDKLPMPEKVAPRVGPPMAAMRKWAKERGVA